MTAAIITLTAGPVSAFEAGASEWIKTKQTAIRLISTTKTVGDSEALSLGLHFKLKPGWKIYWRSPGDAGFPPEPNWGRSENVESATLRWPAPERFSVFGLETLGYTREVVLPITVRRSNATSPLKLSGNVRYLVCDNICIPYDADVALRLDIGNESPSRFAHLINRFDATVPSDGKRHRISIDTAETWSDGDGTWLRIKASSTLPFKAPDIFPEGPPIVTFSKPSITLEPKGHSVILDMRVFGTDELDDQVGKTLAGRELTLTIVDGRRSAETKLNVYFANPKLTAQKPESEPTLLVILGLAILGGFILNFMPCVLPVLSIKLLSVLDHGGGKAKLVRLSFLASAAGILVAFLVLAITLIALKAGGMTVGWGIQFQQPWFLIFLTILMMGFACNLWGIFEIRLPFWVSHWSARSENARGLSRHFLQGAFATLMATPCSAPFLGTAIGFSLARSWIEISTVFTALGVGLALPYLAVAAFPGLASRLPKPGPWMTTLRRFLGLALAATWVWLLFVLATNIGTIGSVVVGGLTVLAAGLLFFGRHAFLSITVAILTPFLVLGLLGKLPSKNAVENLAINSHYSSESELTKFWTEFNEAAIPELIARGKTVFVDVTASWCLTCQANKRLVLETEAVLQAFKTQQVVAMRADWTRPDPIISAYLARYGRYGIPFNAVYGPALPDGIVLPELLSRNEILDAFSRASKTSKTLKRKKLNERETK